MQRKLLTTLILMFFFLNSYVHASPKVTVTVAPIHSLVSSLMRDIAEPALLLQPFDSPHTFQMTPGDLSKIQGAELIIFVSEELENFLIKPLQQVKAEKFCLINLPKLKKLPLRVEFHQHAHAGHSHGHFDPHIWLNTENAKIISEAIAQQLIQLDPEHQEQYQQNLQTLLLELDHLTQHIQSKLKDHHEKSYIVFHDAYQYFESQFNLQPGEVITFHPDVPLSAKRISVLRRIIQKKSIQCAFIEPEFNADMVSKMFPTLKIHKLDPLGALVPLGTKNYSNLMMNMADEMSGCFSE